MQRGGVTGCVELGFDLGVCLIPRPLRVLLWLLGRICVLSALGLSPGTRAIFSSFCMFPWRRVLCPSYARLSESRAPEREVNGLVHFHGDQGLGGSSSCDSLHGAASAGWVWDCDRTRVECPKWHQAPLDVQMPGSEEAGSQLSPKKSYLLSLSVPAWVDWSLAPFPFAGL